MQIIESIPSDAKKYEPPKIDEIRDFLRSRVVGQDQAVERISQELVHALSGLKTNPDGPRGSVLMLGPSGVGKTETALAVVDCLLQHSNVPPEDRDPEKFLLKIDCGEYTQSHHVAMLIGSPAGYVGSKGSRGPEKSEYIPPGLGVEALEAHTFKLSDNEEISVILLDEIEKAHVSIRDYLLAALDRGITKTAANEKVNFRNTIFLFTSNLGNHELAQIKLQGESIGFGGGVGNDELTRANQAKEISWRALKQNFRPEDISRMSGSARGAVIFEALDRSASEKILGIQLGRAEQEFVKYGIRLEFQMTAEARDQLLNLGIDQETGARALKEVVKTQIIQPLLHPSRQKNIETLNGRVVYIDFTDKAFSFYTADTLEKATVVSSKDSGKSRESEEDTKEQTTKQSEAMRKTEATSIEEISISQDAQQRMNELGVTFDKNTLSVNFARSDLMHGFDFDNYSRSGRYSKIYIFVPETSKNIALVLRLSNQLSHVDFGIDNNGFPYSLGIQNPEKQQKGRATSYSWHPLN